MDSGRGETSPMDCSSVRFASATGTNRSAIHSLREDLMVNESSHSCRHNLHNCCHSQSRQICNAKLSRAACVEDALPGPWNLEVEAVLTVHIIAYVRDLNNHGFADQVWMRATPVAIGVFLIHESKLVALSTVVITSETMRATHSYSCKAHAETTVHKERLVVGAARS